MKAIDAIKERLSTLVGSEYDVEEHLRVLYVQLDQAAGVRDFVESNPGWKAIERGMVESMRKLDAKIRRLSRDKRANEMELAYAVASRDTYGVILAVVKKTGPEYDRILKMIDERLEIVEGNGGESVPGIG